jgi:hypothetical protein
MMHSLVSSRSTWLRQHAGGRRRRNIVRHLNALALGLAAVCTPAAALGADPSRGNMEPAPSIVFLNGLWFDGTRFRPATFYSVAGVLRDGIDTN